MFCVSTFRERGRLTSHRHVQGSAQRSNTQCIGRNARVYFRDPEARDPPGSLGLPYPPMGKQKALIAMRLSLAYPHLRPNRPLLRVHLASPPRPGLKYIVEYIVFKAFAPDIQPDVQPDVWPDVWPEIIHGYYPWMVSMDIIHG